MHSERGGVDLDNGRVSATNFPRRCRMSWLRNTLVALGALTAVTLAAQAAEATPGYVTSSVSLRAGPSTSYPRVVLLQRGALVEIYGCINGFAWCDIDWRGYRGWVRGAYLQVLYQQHRR